MFEGENKREKMLVLLTMCFALFMAMLDNTVVNVALPTLSRELGAGVSGLQWIVDGYVLAFASLMLTGGILGDRYGRKRMFISGLALFTFASALCGLSGSTGLLVAARSLQGVGAALLMPGTLSIITVTFPAHERAKAIGIWAGVSGLALAFGPTAGGWIVENIGWQAVFFINVPIGIAGLFVGMRVVRESRSEQARALDIGGLLLGTTGLFAMTYGLIEANQKGWTDPLIMTALIAAAVLFVVFIVYEQRTADPMMPLSFFRVPAFAAGNAVAFAVSLGMFGTFFFMSLYMQFIRGYSALQTGVRFMPLTGMIIFAAPTAGRYASKHGSRGPMTLGLSMAGVGLILLSRASIDTSYLTMMPVLIGMGAGMGMTMTPMTAAVMNSVGPARAGLGSAMTNTSREIGGVFGIALLGTLLTTKMRTALSASLASIALPASQKAEIIAGAGRGFDPSALAGLPPAQAEAVRGAYGLSFLSGFHLALLIGGLVVLAAAIISARFIPRGAPQRELLNGQPELAAPAAH
jgi:EmrB/QacA subfamily drug resistance transporter